MSTHVNFKVIGADIAPTHSAVVVLYGRPGDLRLVKAFAITKRQSDMKLAGPQLDLTLYPAARLKELSLELTENVQVAFMHRWMLHVAESVRALVGAPHMVSIEGWPYDVDRGAHQSGAASGVARTTLFPDVPHRLHDVYAVKIGATGTGSHPKGESKKAVIAGVCELEPLIAAWSKLHDDPLGDICDAYTLARLGVYELTARLTGVDPDWPEQFRRVLLRTTDRYPEAPVSRELISPQAALARVLKEPTK